MFSPTIDFSALSHRGIPTKHNNPFTDMPDGNELVEDWDFGLEETYQSGNLQKNESEGVLIDVCDDDDKEDRDVEGLIEAFGTVKIRTTPPLTTSSPWSKKDGLKDFFSPLKLERVFDPPSKDERMMMSTSNVKAGRNLLEELRKVSAGNGKGKVAPAAEVEVEKDEGMGKMEETDYPSDIDVLSDVTDAPVVEVKMLPSMQAELPSKSGKMGMIRNLNHKAQSQSKREASPEPTEQPQQQLLQPTTTTTTASNTVSSTSSTRRPIQHVNDVLFSRATVIPPHASPVPRRVGDMIYDEVNKRWMNVNHEEEVGLELEEGKEEVKLVDIEQEPEAEQPQEQQQQEQEPQQPNESFINLPDRLKSLAQRFAEKYHLDSAETSRVISEASLTDLENAMNSLANIQKSFWIRPGDLTMTDKTQATPFHSRFLNRTDVSIYNMRGLEGAMQSLAKCDGGKEGNQDDEEEEEVLEDVRHILPDELSNRLMGGSTSFTQKDAKQSQQILQAHISKVTGMGDELSLLEKLDLSNRRLDSVLGLDILVPNLKELVLDNNQISYLQGIPFTVSTLSVIRNRLSSLTCFLALSNIEYLDVSRNCLEDLSAINCLVHLRELVADENGITCLEPLRGMMGLLKVSLRHNRIKEIELRDSKLKRLQLLDISHNDITHVSNIESLISLEELYLSHNLIDSINLTTPLPSLKILDLRWNDVSTFDGKHFPNLTILDLTKNCVKMMTNELCLQKLVTLQLGGQRIGGTAPVVSYKEIGTLVQLDLSELPFKDLDSLAHNHKLEVLLLSSTFITTITKPFARHMVNLREVDLSKNNLSDVSNLKYCKAICKLSLRGCRLESVEAVLRPLRHCKLLQEVDLRNNPLTTKFYSLSDDNNSKTDKLFIKSLNDEDYVRRLVYRSTLIHTLKQPLEVLDGVVITETEWKKTERVVLKLKKMKGRKEKEKLKLETANGLGRRMPSSKPKNGADNGVEKNGNGSDNERDLKDDFLVNALKSSVKLGGLRGQLDVESTNTNVNANIPVACAAEPPVSFWVDIKPKSEPKPTTTTTTTTTELPQATTATGMPIPRMPPFLRRKLSLNKGIKHAFSAEEVVSNATNNVKVPSLLPGLGPVTPSMEKLQEMSDRGKKWIELGRQKFLGASGNLEQHKRVVVEATSRNAPAVSIDNTGVNKTRENTDVDVNKTVKREPWVPIQHRLPMREKELRGAAVYLKY